jgi:hypothetical protein
LQLVDAAHERKRCKAHRLGVVVHRDSADAQQLRLLLDLQFDPTVDHRFALSNPALASAPSQQSIRAAGSFCRTMPPRDAAGLVPSRPSRPGLRGMVLTVPCPDALGHCVYQSVAASERVRARGLLLPDRTT